MYHMSVCIFELMGSLELIHQDNIQFCVLIRTCLGKCGYVVRPCFLTLAISDMHFYTFTTKFKSGYRNRTCYYGLVTCSFKKICFAFWTDFHCETCFALKRLASFREDLFHFLKTAVRLKDLLFFLKTFFSFLIDLLCFLKICPTF